MGWWCHNEININELDWNNVCSMRKSQCQKLYPLCICHWCFHKILSAPYRAHSDWIHCVRSCVFSRRITRQHSVSVEVFCESTWGLDYLRNVLNGFGQARDHETWGLVSWSCVNPCPAQLSCHQDNWPSRGERRAWPGGERELRHETLVTSCEYAEGSQTSTQWV